MSIKEEISEVEEQMLQLIRQLQDIRAQIDAMEKQNNNLRDKISEEKIAGDGQEALRSLYDEGYHICSLHYGEDRHDEDCIFCLNFLNDDNWED